MVTLQAMLDQLVFSARSHTCAAESVRFGWGLGSETAGHLDRAVAGARRQPGAVQLQAAHRGRVARQVHHGQRVVGSDVPHLFETNLQPHPSSVGKCTERTLIVLSEEPLTMWSSSNCTHEMPEYVER